MFLFLENPVRPAIASITSFILGLNISSSYYDAMSFFLQNTAFIVSIAAGLVSIYSIIKKSQNERISKRKR